MNKKSTLMAKICQNSFIIVTFYLALCLVDQPARTDAECNVCSPYGIACANETSFNLCQNGVPKTDSVYNCPSGRQCSDTSAKCVEPQANVTATCQISVATCGVCDGTRIFVCTSRRGFVQCDGVTATNITGTCSNGLVCDSQSGELCKNECTRPAVLECDRDTPL